MSTVMAVRPSVAAIETDSTGGVVSPLRDSLDWTHTPVELDSTFNPGLHYVFKCFDGAFDQSVALNQYSLFISHARTSTWNNWSMSVPVTVIVSDGKDVEAAPNTHTADTLSAIEWLQETLGLTLKDTLTAADVKKRTYHSWTKMAASSRPQTRSQGRLWELLDTVETLSELLDQPVKHWLLADNSRTAMLQDGDFADLVRSAVPAGAGEAFRPQYRLGVGAEADFPIMPGPGGKPVTVPISR